MLEVLLLHVSWITTSFFSFSIEILFWFFGLITEYGETIVLYRLIVWGKYGCHRVDDSVYESLPEVCAKLEIFCGSQSWHVCQNQQSECMKQTKYYHWPVVDWQLLVCYLYIKSTYTSRIQVDSFFFVFLPSVSLSLPLARLLVGLIYFVDLRHCTSLTLQQQREIINTKAKNEGRLIYH